MDNMLVPVSMTKTSKNIDNFNKDKPEFDWVVFPQNKQIIIDLLLRNLDQALTSASSGISPPRGLSSINYLGFNSASIHSTSGKFSDIIIN
jgi:hypothetical protein